MTDRGWKLLRKSVAGVATLCLAGGFAAAQQPSPAPEPQQKTQQENWQHTPSGKMGKEEPSSHAPSAPSAPLVNGSLAVPGAPHSDMVPAKFSEQNAADDELATVGYTFKYLSAEQRRTVYQALKNEPSTTTAVAAEIGTELPNGVELRPLPASLSAQLPQLTGYQYVASNDRFLLVSPPTRYVVGVFGKAD